jgi:hypothetical protein
LNTAARVATLTENLDDHPLVAGLVQRDLLKTQDVLLVALTLICSFAMLLCNHTPLSHHQAALGSHTAHHALGLGRVEWRAYDDRADEEVEWYWNSSSQKSFRSSHVHSCRRKQSIISQEPQRARVAMMAALLAAGLLASASAEPTASPAFNLSATLTSHM